MKKIRERLIEKVEPLEYTPRLKSEKDKTRFINDVKKIVRSSMEYRDYIAYLKTYMDMDHCAFFEKVSSHDSSKIKIEVHHEPFTLHDYIKCIIDKYIDEGKECNAFDIADDVVRLHYENKVGLIPLSATMHELVHSGSGKIVIPLWMIYGNYAEFLEEYEAYASDEAIFDKLEDKIIASKSVDEHTFDFLKNEFEYLNMEGVEAPKTIEIFGVGESEEETDSPILFSSLLQFNYSLVYYNNEYQGKECMCLWQYIDQI